MKVIESCAVRPREGVALIKRRELSYTPVVGDPWPELVVGELLVVHDTLGWTWDVTVEEIVQADSPEDVQARVRVHGERTPQPMPPIVDGCIELPTMREHAHGRFWRKGDVVLHEGQYYKVAKAREIRHRGNIEYTLTPATERQYATRPARVSFDSERDAFEALGSAVQVSDGWLHVKRLTKSTFRGALGRGTIYWGVGNYCAPEKARKLNEIHADTLSRDLMGHGKRVRERMPEGSVQLVPRKAHSLAASGERVAIVDGAVLHERCGDPDQIDSWYHYVVQITDPGLVKRVERFIKSKR